MNKSLNILSVAPDRVQNKFNHGVNKNKTVYENKQTNTGRKIQKGT